MILDSSGYSAVGALANGPTFLPFDAVLSAEVGTSHRGSLQQENKGFYKPYRVL